MVKKYAQDFKEKYSFLEEYGFVFAVDPFNSNRPCYKNLYGEHPDEPLYISNNQTRINIIITPTFRVVNNKFFLESKKHIKNTSTTNLNDTKSYATLLYNISVPNTFANNEPIKKII